VEHCSGLGLLVDDVEAVIDENVADIICSVALKDFWRWLMINLQAV